RTPQSRDKDVGVLPGFVILIKESQLSRVPRLLRRQHLVIFSVKYTGSFRQVSRHAGVGLIAFLPIDEIKQRAVYVTVAILNTKFRRILRRVDVQVRDVSKPVVRQE